MVIIPNIECTHSFICVWTPPHKMCFPTIPYICGCDCVCFTKSAPLRCVRYYHTITQGSGVHIQYATPNVNFRVWGQIGEVSQRRGAWTPHTTFLQGMGEERIKSIFLNLEESKEWVWRQMEESKEWVFCQNIVGYWSWFWKKNL